MNVLREILHGTEIATSPPWMRLVALLAILVCHPALLSNTSLAGDAPQTENLPFVTEAELERKSVAACSQMLVDFRPNRDNQCTRKSEDEVQQSPYCVCCYFNGCGCQPINFCLSNGGFCQQYC